MEELISNEHIVKLQEKIQFLSFKIFFFTEWLIN